MGPEARSRRPRLKRLPRSHRGGLQHLLQEPGAANAGFPYPESMTPGESLTDTLAAASTSYGPDKIYTPLGAGEAKRLAEYIPGPPRFSLRGRTRGEERRVTTDAQGLVSLEDELEIAQAREEEAMLEEAYMADAGVSIEMPTGKIQDLPPPPTTQAELFRSPSGKRLNFRNASRSTVSSMLGALRL